MWWEHGESSSYDTQKVKVLSLPETIKEKSTFRAKALRRELVVLSSTNSRRRTFTRNVDFSFTVSGSERTFTFRVSLNTLPILATLVRVFLLLLFNSILNSFKEFLFREFQAGIFCRWGHIKGIGETPTRSMLAHDCMVGLWQRSDRTYKYTRGNNRRG